ncbi:MAG: hypothetical protein JRG80_07060 [Deltaproteobacteria bacterium]|nr:hypothetical protein [Deltaproteobacteria bacterium]
MAWSQLIKAPNVLAAISLVMASLLPTVASAGWGDENWGEMVWGAAAPQIPSMPVEGNVALAMLLVGLSYWLLASRRRRLKHPPLHS